MPVQPTLDGTMPPPVPDYATWVDTVRPTFVEVARTGESFLFWRIARDHQLPEPPDRDHDWGRLAAQLHREGITRTNGFGLTRDKSSVRRWRGTRAAQAGRVA
ncbi:hypothetical protein ACIGCZ_37055 [Streptomyces nigra]|uniref:hypothetical protein n=1 Tax=Streptomyces nigra TaxID=1827580 RepID=UPI0037D8B8E7